MPYKIYKNTKKLYLASNLNTMPIQKWKLVLNKAICVSFFCSLVINSLPPLSKLRGNSSFNSTSNVLLDANGETIKSSDCEIGLQVIDVFFFFSNRERIMPEGINK